MSQDYSSPVQSNAVEMPPPRDRYSLPWPSLGLLAFLTLASFLAAAIGFAYFTHTGTHAAERIREASTLSGEIGRLDEVLTMSANMAAQSGDPQWAARYEKNAPLLDAAIKHAMSLAPPIDARQFSSSTQAANDRLVAMETDALANVRADKRDLARKILSGAAYARDKGRYAAGLRTLIGATDRELRAAQAQLFNLNRILIWGLIATGLLIAASWIRLVQVLRRWRSGMIAAEQERLRAAHIEIEREAEAMRKLNAQTEREAQIQRAAEEAQRRVDMQNEAEMRRIAAQNQQRKELIAIAERFEGSVGQVAEKLSLAAGELQDMAASLAATAERTSVQATAVASASGQTAASVKSISRAGEEVYASTLEISQQAAVSAEISARAVQEMAQSERSMDLLTENTELIGRVTDMIASIAGRTRLLAINATIEASRASEGGRGFVVVANEIKALALQTANATQQIGSQISTVRSATDQSAAALRASSSTLGHIDRAATAIAAATHQQSYAASEVARHVQDVAEGTENVSQSIGEVSEAAEGAGRAAKDLLRSATDLAGDAAFLREQVSEFLKTVRAA
jgi:methyl-accepting chemotaxis protein